MPSKIITAVAVCLGCLTALSTGFFAYISNRDRERVDVFGIKVNTTDPSISTIETVAASVANPATCAVLGTGFTLGVLAIKVYNQITPITSAPFPQVVINGLIRDIRYIRGIEPEPERQLR
jgi:hypothetical protein